MRKGVKRSVGLISALACFVCYSSTLLAEASEYTIGIREKNFSLSSYVYSADDLNKTAFSVYKFTDNDEYSLAMRIEDEGQCLGNTFNGAYIRFNRMDFGKNGGPEALKITFAHVAGYTGVLRAYAIPCGAKKPSMEHGKINDTGAKLILEYDFSEDYTTGGWYNKKTEELPLKLRDLNGVYDIVFTFSRSGMGNYYDFEFVNGEAESDNEENKAEQSASCESVRKFSDADEYNYSDLKPGAAYIGNTGGGKWLLYRNVDFGSEGVESFNFKSAKDGEHRGFMKVYLLEAGTEVTSAVPDNARLILSKARNSNDNTDTWYTPKEESVPVENGAFINGIYDVMITFSYLGLGNFYDFSFTKCNGVLMSNAGELRCEEYIPFDISGVTLSCVAEKASNISVEIDGEKITGQLTEGENYISADFENSVFKGDKTVTITTDGYTELKSLTANKRKAEIAYVRPYSQYDEYSGIIYSDTEKLLKTAIVFNADSSVYITGNAKSYINYDDASETPYIENEIIYAPIEAIALSTGAYFEENDDFALIRFGNNEILYKNGTQYRQENNGSYYAVENDMIKVNGKFYAPLKEYLELSGRSVAEKDGYIIADTRLKLKNIMENKKNFESVKECFKEFLPSQSSSNTYYVAQTANASDSNSGTREEPFLTISKAAQSANAGDTVIIGEGIYRETVKPSNNGTASNPIVFRAAEGERVVVSALNQAENYTMEDDKRVYTLEKLLPQGRNMIFRNGEALAEGRYPNIGSVQVYEDVKSKLQLSPLWPVSGKIKIDNQNAVIEEDGAFENDYFKGATLVARNGKGWTLSTAKVASSENKTLTLEEHTVNWWYDESRSNDFGYLTGFKNSVDIPGEWYADTDNNRLYIIPIDENDTYEFKARQLCVDLTDREYVQFNGIDTIGGGINMDNAKMCVLNNGEYKYLSHYTYSADQHYGFFDSLNKTDNGNELLLNASGAPKRGESGIYLGGSDNAVINSKISYSAAAGIYDTEKYSFIYNNTIEETGYMCAYVGGIFIMPDFTSETINDVRGGHRIYYNTIDKTGRACLEVSAKEEEWFQKEGLTPFAASDIAYNKISNGSILARDTGNVYIHGVILGDDESKTKLRNNIVSNLRATDSDLSWGIYFDNWSQMAEAYENILTYTDYSANIERTKEILVQPKASFPTSFCYVNLWNNKLLENKRELPLKNADYPNSKRFRCGADSENENADTDISKPSSFENEAVTVQLELDDSDNALEVYYISNPFKTRSNIKILINGEAYEFRNDVGAMSEGYINSEIIPLDGFSGETIMVSTEDSRICSVKAIETEKVKIFGKCYGGEYDEGSANIKSSPDGQHQMMYQTWSNYTVKYSDIYIGSKIDTAVMSYSTSTENSGGIVKIRIGENSEPVEFVTSKNSWDDYSPAYAKLPQAVEAGVYDIYVDIQMKQPQTINLWWFGFANESENTQNAYEKLDLTDESRAYNAEFTDDGILVTEASVIDLRGMDFGEADVFSLIADYTLTENSDLSFVVEADEQSDNLLFNPEAYSGTHYGIFSELQSSGAIEGVHNIKIKFKGGGSALIKKLEFKRAKTYISEFEKNSDKIRVKLNATANKTVAAVYTTDGVLKKVNIYDSPGGNIEFNVEEKGEFILKIFEFDSLNTILPTSKPIIYANK